MGTNTSLAASSFGKTVKEAGTQERNLVMFKITTRGLLPSDPGVLFQMTLHLPNSRESSRALVCVRMGKKQKIRWTLMKSVIRRDVKESDWNRREIPSEGFSRAV